MGRKLQHPGSTSSSATAANKGNVRSNTKPEVKIRSLLQRCGYRFRKDLFIKLNDIEKARPDIVFTKKKVAVFIDGCFWHFCPLHGKIPQSNILYWIPKLEGNVQRDRLTDNALQTTGWTVLRIWEHEKIEDAVEKIIKTVNSV